MQRNMQKTDPDAFFASLPANALYALCDEGLLEQYGMSVGQFADLCRRHDVRLIQYRNKNGSDAEVRRRLERLRGVWEGLLIINDRWQLHPLCDGVHLGQEDLAALHADAAEAVAILRREIGAGKVIGLSTHNAAEIAAANSLPIDYIGLGAYRATGTKTDAGLLGEKLDALAAASRHPVAAIGGITFTDRFGHAAMRVMGRALFEAAE